jgi:hypothetical protein
VVKAEVQDSKKDSVPEQEELMVDMVVSEELDLDLIKKDKNVMFTLRFHTRIIGNLPFLKEVGVPVELKICHLVVQEEESFGLVLLIAFT